MTEQEHDEGNSPDKGKIAFDWAVKVVTAVALTMATFVGKDIVGAVDALQEATSALGERTTALESSALTVADGVTLRAEMQRIQVEIQRVWTEFGQYPKREEVPPALFKQRVDDAVRAIERLEERVRDLEKSKSG